MVQSIQYHKDSTLYHVTEAEAEELAEKYCNNKNENHNSIKGMKSASKENSGIVVKEPVSCHQTPQSSKKGEVKKDETNYNMGGRRHKQKTEVDLEEQVNTTFYKENMSYISKEENYC